MNDFLIYDCETRWAPRSGQLTHSKPRETSTPLGRAKGKRNANYKEQEMKMLLSAREHRLMAEVVYMHAHIAQMQVRSLKGSYEEQ